MDHSSRGPATVIGSLLLVVAAVALGVLLLQWTATLLVSGDSTKDYAQAVNAARVSLIQFFGGIALLGGLLYTARTYALSKVTQRAEWFTHAVEQMGNEDSLGVRLGGIHALGMIAQAENRYWDVLDQILSAFVREKGTAGGNVTADIQACMNVLAHRGKRSVEAWEALDLRGAQLSGVRMSGKDFGRAILRGADLEAANLTDATLTAAQFEGASLLGAVLSGADCRRANFASADLRDAELLGSQFDGATITEAQPGTAKHPPEIG